MPMISLAELLKGKNDFGDQEDTGRVIDNNDPLKLGRVKLRTARNKSVPKDLVPWSRPADSGVANAGKGVGSTNIPPMGAKVMLTHDGGDPHFPAYRGTPATADVYNENNEGNPHADQNGDYPWVRGFKDIAGNVFRVNMKEGKESLSFTDVHGNCITLDKNGLAFAINGNITASAKGGKATVVSDTEVVLNSKQPLNIKSPNINVNGDGGDADVIDSPAGERPAVSYSDSTPTA